MRKIITRRFLRNIESSTVASSEDKIRKICGQHLAHVKNLFSHMRLVGQLVYVTRIKPQHLSGIRMETDNPVAFLLASMAIPKTHC